MVKRVLASDDPRAYAEGIMNPIKKILSEAITDLKEDLSVSNAELEFLKGFEAGKKSWWYARLSLHIEFLNLKIEICKALGGV